MDPPTYLCEGLEKKRFDPPSEAPAEDSAPMFNSDVLSQLISTVDDLHSGVDEGDGSGRGAEAFMRGDRPHYVTTGKDELTAIQGSKK